MDPGKSNALIEWVNCIRVGQPVHSLSQLGDGHHLLGIVFRLRKHEIKEHLKKKKWTDTVHIFLREFFGINFHHVVDFGEARNGNEFELAKVATAVLCATVQHDRKDEFIHLLLTLGHESQLQIKSIIESAIMDNDCRIKTNFDEVLLAQNHSNLSSEHSRTSSHQVSRQSCSSPPQSPIVQLMQSPQMLQKTAMWNRDSRIQQLEFDLAKERKLRESMSAEMNQAQEEVDAKDQEIGRLMKELTTLKKTQEKLSMYRELLHQETDAVSCGDGQKNKFSDIETSYKSLESSYKELCKENGSLQDKIEELEKLASLYQQKCSTDELTEEQLSSAQHSVAKKEIEIETLRFQLQDTKKDLDELRQIYDERIKIQSGLADTSCDSATGEPMTVITDQFYMELQLAHEQLQTQFSQITDEKVTLDNQVQLLGEELATFTRSYAEDKERLDQCIFGKDTKICELEAACAELKIQDRELQVQLSATYSVVGELTSQLAQERAAAEEAEKMRLQLVTDLQNVNEVVATRNGEIISLLTTSDEAKALELELRGQIGGKCSEIVDLNDLLLKEKMSVESLEEHCSQLAIHLDASQDEFSAKCDEFRLAREEAGDLEERLREQLMDRRLEIDELTVLLKQETSAVADLEVRCSWLETDVMEARKDVKFKKSEISQLQTNCDDAKNLEEQLNIQLSAKIAEINELVNIQEQLNCEVQELKGGLKQLDNQIRNMNKDISTKSQKICELEMARDEAKILELRLANEMNAKNVEIATAHEQMAQLSTLLNLEKSAVKALEVRCSQLDTDAQGAMEDVAVKQEEILQLLAKCDDSETLGQQLSIQLSEKCAEIEELVKDIANKTHKINELEIACEEAKTSELWLGNEINEKNTEIAATHEQLAELSTVLNQEKSSVADLEEKCSQLETVVGKITEDNKIKQSEIMQLHTDCDDAKNLGQKLNIQLSEKCAKIEELVEDISSKDQKINELEIACEEAKTVELQLNKEINENYTKIAATQEQLAELSTVLNQEKSAVADLEVKCSQLGTVVGEITEDNDVKKSEIMQLKTDCDDAKNFVLQLNLQMSEKCAKIEELVEDISSKNQKINELEIACKEAKTLELQLNKEINENNTKITSTQKQLAELSTVLNQEKTAVTNLKVKCTQQERDVRESTEDIEVKKSEILALQTNYNDAKNLGLQLNLQLSVKCAKIEELVKDISNKSQNIGELEMACDEAKTLVLELNKEIKENNAEVAITKEKLAELSGLLNQVKTAASNYEAKCTQPERDVRESTEDIEVKRSEILALRTNYDNAKNHGQQLNLHLSEISAEIEEMVVDICTKNQKIGELENACDKAKTLELRLGNEINEKNTEIAATQEQLAELSTVLNEKNSALNDLQESVLQLEQDLANEVAVSAERSQTISDLQAALHEGRLLHQDFDDQLKDKNAEISVKDDRMADLMARLDQEKTTTKILEEERLKVEKRLEDAVKINACGDSEIVRLRTLCDETKSLELQLNDTLTKKCSEIATSETQAAKLAASLDEKESVVKEFGLKVETLEKELGDAVKDATNKNEKIGELETACEVTKKAEHQLADLLTGKIAELDALTVAFDQEKSKSGNSEEKMTQLENNLQDAIKIIEEKDHKIAELESASKEAKSQELNLSCQLNTASTEISANQKLIGNLTVALLQEKSEMNERGKNLEEIRSQFENDLDEQRGRLTFCSFEKNREISDLKVALDLAKSLESELISQIDDKNVQVDAQEERFKAVADQLNLEKTALLVLKERCSQLEQKLKDSSDDSACKDREIGLLKSTDQHIREEKDEQQTVIATLRQNVEDLETKFEREQTAADRAKEDFLVLQIDLDDARTKILELERVVAEKESRIKSVVFEIDRERSKFSFELSQKTAELDHLRAEHARTEILAEERRKSLDDVKRTEAAANKEEKLDREIRMLTLKINSLEAQNRRLNAQLQTSQQEIETGMEKLERQVEETEEKNLSICAALQDQAQTVQRKYEKAKEYLALANRKSTEMEREVERLEHVSRTLQVKLDGALLSFKGEQGRTADLEHRLHQAERKSTVLAEKQQQQESSRNQMSLELRNLQVQLKFATDQLRRQQKEDPWPSRDHRDHFQAPNVSIISSNDDGPVYRRHDTSTMDTSVARLANSTTLSAIENIPGGGAPGRSVPAGAGSYFACAEEEGEVFEVSFLNDMKRGRCETDHENQSVRISELQRRNTLCLPHLKTSYPVEMQVKASHEFRDEDLKAGRAVDDSIVSCSSSGRTAPESNSYSFASGASKTKPIQPTYHKPGPPTPGKSSRSAASVVSDKLSKTPASLKKLFYRGNGAAAGGGTPKRRTPQKRDVENRPPESASRSRRNLAFSIGFSPKVKSKPKQSLTVTKTQTIRPAQAPARSPPSPTPPPSKLPTRRR